MLTPSMLPTSRQGNGIRPRLRKDRRIIPMSRRYLFGSMMGGPLPAVITAQSQAAMASANYINRAAGGVAGHRVVGACGRRKRALWKTLFGDS